MYGKFVGVEAGDVQAVDVKVARGGAPDESRPMAMRPTAVATAAGTATALATVADVSTAEAPTVVWPRLR